MQEIDESAHKIISELHVKCSPHICVGWAHVTTNALSNAATRGREILALSHAFLGAKHYVLN